MIYENQELLFQQHGATKWRLTSGLDANPIRENIHINQQEPRSGDLSGLNANPTIKKLFWDPMLEL